jgi:hypothetical protein
MIRHSLSSLQAAVPINCSISWMPDGGSAPTTLGCAPDARAGSAQETVASPTVRKSPAAAPQDQPLNMDMDMDGIGCREA